MTQLYSQTTNKLKTKNPHLVSNPSPQSTQLTMEQQQLLKSKVTISSLTIHQRQCVGFFSGTHNTLFSGAIFALNMVVLHFCACISFTLKWVSCALREVGLFHFSLFFNGFDIIFSNVIVFVFVFYFIFLFGFC
jgi:hypothetical protein